MWQPCNECALLCPSGQRRGSFRRPGGQAEEPKLLSQRHWWIQGPREHGNKLQPAALRRQADGPAHFYLHDGGWRRHWGIPHLCGGAQWVHNTFAFFSVRILGIFTVQQMDHCTYRALTLRCFFIVLQRYPRTWRFPTRRRNWRSASSQRWAF